jgi:ferrochelatase
MTPSPYAVLLVSFGGPEKPDDVLPFMEAVSRDRNIPPARIKEVTSQYKQIGGCSPVNEITRQQAKALGAFLSMHLPLLRGKVGMGGVACQNMYPPPQSFPSRGEEAGIPVYVCYRNCHPFLEETLQKMSSEGIARVVTFIMSAHRSEASYGRYVQALDEARQRIPNAPTITYVDPWFDHPLFINAVCERIIEAASSPASYWVFTAHSLPNSMAQSSHYVEELFATTESVCRKLNHSSSWSFSYTSRSASIGWLEPDIRDLLRKLAAKDIRDVLVIPIGFVSDNMEVLFDLDVAAREAAEKAGIHFRRAQTVGTHPLFIRMMAELVCRAPA